MAQAVHELNRYARQQIIEGWNQDRLKNGSVAIVGAGVLAREIAIPLAALGIGRIRIIGLGEDHGVLDMPARERTYAESLEDCLSKINSDITVRGIDARIASTACAYLLQGVNCIIDATNDPRSKAVCLNYGALQSIPVISASSMPNYGKLVLSYAAKPKQGALMQEFEEHAQDDFVAAVLGGLAAEEVKRILMYSGRDFEKSMLEHPVYYNPLHPERFAARKLDDKVQELPNKFPDASALIVGAGALGNFAAKQLAQMHLKRVDVIDPDEVEPTNLNRQVLYYDCIGEAKALALSRKLAAMSNGRTKSSGIVALFEQDSKLPAKYDVIFDCVDSDIARKAMNAYANANKIPLVSGGTDVNGGRCIVYVPGKTTCLCQVNIEQRAAEEDVRRRQSCVLAPNPSVIMTNQVIGSMMALEARTVFSAEKYGQPFNGRIKLTNAEYRVGINPLTSTCKCCKGGA